MIQIQMREHILNLPNGYYSANEWGVLFCTTAGVPLVRRLRMEWNVARPIFRPARSRGCRKGQKSHTFFRARLTDWLARERLMQPRPSRYVRIQPPRSGWTPHFLSINPTYAEVHIPPEEVWWNLCRGRRYSRNHLEINVHCWVLN